MSTQITILLTHGEVLKAVGKNARKLREARGFSRRDLAKRSGVSVPTISRFELNGVITLSAMVKLAQALNCVESFSILFESPKYHSIEEFIQREG